VSNETEAIYQDMRDRDRADYYEGLSRCASEVSSGKMTEVVLAHRKAEEEKRAETMKVFRPQFPTPATPIQQPDVPRATDPDAILALPHPLRPSEAAILRRGVDAWKKELEGKK
jgi:hypothetical protein